MELKTLMKNAGLVGAGGAGFPSYAKLAEGADTLLINGSECEPLLYTDLAILSNELPTVLVGAAALLDGTGIPRAILAVKAHTATRLSLSDGEELAPRITVKVLRDRYPVGDELGLIYETLGRSVRGGALPISVGVIVYNVETVYNLGGAVLGGKPVTEKWLTVGGETERATVLRVPIGTRVSDLLSRLGITVRDDQILIDGGPSMGKPIRAATAVVTKTTKGILVIPRRSPAAVAKESSERMAIARAETACCGCSRCTDMCPRHLLGYPLEPHKMVRTAVQAATVNPVLVLSATLCCGCGVCETLACSQGISPRAVINGYKALLAKEKIRYTGREDIHARPERDWRTIPSGRWASALGVASLDRMAEYGGVLSDFERVEIPLGRQIGLPSTPAVESGATVRRGDLIARAAEGLSVPQHASIDGRVTLAGDKIIIDRIRYDV